MAEESGSINCSGKISFCSARVQRFTGVKQLPIQCLRHALLLLSSDFTVKLTDHSLPLNAVVKNAWSLVFPEV
jgi:hypothetical protein